MSLQTKPFDAGPLWGVIVDLPISGDKLAWHTHKPADAHISICARGQVKMDVGHPDGHGGYVIENSVVLETGHCVDTEHGVYHQFTAEMDNSRLFNIAKVNR